MDAARPFEVGQAGDTDADAGAGLGAPATGRSAVRPATCETMLDIEAGGEIGLAGPVTSLPLPEGIWVISVSKNTCASATLIVPVSTLPVGSSSPVNPAAFNVLSAAWASAAEAP